VSRLKEQQKHSGGATWRKLKKERGQGVLSVFGYKVRKGRRREHDSGVWTDHRGRFEQHRGRYGGVNNWKYIMKGETTGTGLKISKKKTTSCANTNVRRGGKSVQQAKKKKL